MKTTLILACAGKGARANMEENKLFFSYNGKTILEHTLFAFSKTGLIDKIIVTASKKDFSKIQELLGEAVTVVLGGDTRTQSVKNALALVDGGVVLIHDGARPFVSKRIITECIEKAREHGSAITAIPSSNTVCKVENGKIVSYLGKDGVYSVQTPQAFLFESIKQAYDKLDNQTFNDDGEVYLNEFSCPYVVLGENKNVKLTYPEDFSALTEQPFRVGEGFDCHKLVENRKLILAGETIPHDKGLLGHSDADVVCHAVMDALLSACGLRDIGYYFPDNDPEYLNANSLSLLRRVVEMVLEQGYKAKSVSVCIMAEKPKLSKFVPIFKYNIARALGIAESEVGISLTTLEGLGFVGREEGICTRVSCIIEKSC